MQVGLVDNKSFASFNWSAIYSVKIENCSETFSRELIAPSKEILTVVEFFGQTLFANLKVVLTVCLNLKSLKLSHLALKDFVPSGGNISVEKLTKLSVFGSGSLTLHEISLLQYFIDKVRTPSLRSFFLEENLFYRQLADITTATLSDGDYTIGNFLAKNCSSIKCLTIERTPIVVKASVETSQQLCNLQLDEFSCNLALSSTAAAASSVGYENLMKHQRQLHSLAINVRGLRTMPSSNVDRFYETIEKCSGTLRTIHFDAISAIGGHDRELNNDVAEVVHDFQIYENCHQLQYLYVGVSIYHRLSLYHLVPGSLRNIQYIQPSIQTLFLIFDVFSEMERNLFAEKLPQLINLRSFSAKGNREMPYRVNFELIHNLIQLPKLRYFLLTGCLIEDFDFVHEFITASPELSEIMEVTPDCCAYTSWRNA